MDYVPKEGEVVPIQLGDVELVRGTVVMVFEDDDLAVQLTAQVFVKDHGYRKNDVVRARRVTHVLSGDRWAAVEKLQV